MTTIGDACHTSTLQAAEPDAAGWQAAFPWPRNAPFIVEPHAGIRPMPPGGLAMARDPQAAMSVPGALQSDDPCPRNCPQGGGHLKAA